MSNPLSDQLQSALAGRYLIDREIGRGGMATVYLARDPRHDRLVALKVLHPDLAAALGPERFLAEIRTTANLQHPHILPLHDSGEADGQLFYVMPFVEGETLRARLERERQLSIRDAVRVAREVASALDYAHRHGVIHRDIKPENILLHDGSALVADFGIALAVQTAGGGRMTQTGLSLGTPQYMSPEQAMGERLIDARSDVYALGAVLYEMLTGDPPFSGSSVQAIVAKVMTERPTAPRITRDTVPAHVEEAVMIALAKVPADRFATAAEFSLAFQAEGALTPRRDAVDGNGTASVARPRRMHTAIAWGVAAVAVLYAGTSSFRGTSEQEPDPVVRTRLELAAGEQLLVGGFSLALSPRGDRLAYISQGPAGIRTYVRRSDEFTSREILVGSPSAYAFSPDGRWLAYEADNVLRKVPSDGGPSVTIGSFPAGINGLAWRSPSEIVVGSWNGLWLIPSAGGTPRRVPTMDSTAVTGLPNLVDDGETLVFMTGGDNRNASELAVVSLSSGKPVRLGLAGIAPRGMVDGHLIYTSAEGALMAVPFDARRKKFTGEPIQLMDRVASVAVSASGTLAYAPRQSIGQLVMVGGGGDDVPVMSEARRYVSPRFSPDGRKIAVAVGAPSSPANLGDIWVYDIDARTFTQVSTDGPVNGVPEWSPDGTRVLYRHDDPPGPRTMWWRPIDGSGPAEPLGRTGESINEALISPDGKWFVYRTTPGGAHSRDIFAVPLAGEASPLLSLAVGPEAAVMPRLSPDGRWLAYASDESGRSEIFVRPFPNPGARIQVTTDGGGEPLWARSGKALVYRSGQAVMSVAVSMSPSFTIGERRMLVTGNYLTEATHQDYDVSPDGTRLLMVKPTEALGNAVIVHNWSREWQEKLAGGRK